MAYAEVEYRCFVGGLSWATDSDALQKAFSQYGEVTDSKIITDRESGRSRGFGFVTFTSEQSLRDAIEAMNGQDFDGRHITVNEAQSRGSGGGGGRGGARREGGYNKNSGGGGYYGGRDRVYGGGGDGGSRYPRGGGGGNWRD